MTTLMALDPGLTATGWALFRLIERPSLLQGLAPALLASGAWTPPGGASRPLETRATWLVEQATRELSLATGPYLVAVEVHAMAQQYARHRGRDRSGRGHMNIEDVAKNRELCGWLAGGLCAVARVIRVPASARGKAGRSASVYDVWPHLAGGRSNEHQRDAIALGMRVLLDGRRPREAA